MRDSTRDHLELLAATIASGMLASHDRGNENRIYIYQPIAADALGIAAEIIKQSKEYIK